MKPKYLFTSGCSFTVGEGLQFFDNNLKYDSKNNNIELQLKKRWGNILAEKLNLELIQYCHNGQGNDKSLREFELFMEFQKINPSEVICVIQLTMPERVSILKPFNNGAGIEIKRNKDILKDFGAHYENRLYELFSKLNMMSSIYSNFYFFDGILHLSDLFDTVIDKNYQIQYPVNTPTANGKGLKSRTLEDYLMRIIIKLTKNNNFIHPYKFMKSWDDWLRDSDVDMGGKYSGGITEDGHPDIIAHKLMAETIYEKIGSNYEL